MQITSPDDLLRLIPPRDSAADCAALLEPLASAGVRMDPVTTTLEDMADVAEAYYRSQNAIPPFPGGRFPRTTEDLAALDAAESYAFFTSWNHYLKLDGSEGFSSTPGAGILRYPGSLLVGGEEIDLSTLPTLSRTRNLVAAEEAVHIGQVNLGPFSETYQNAHRSNRAEYGFTEATCTAEGEEFAVYLYPAELDYWLVMMERNLISPEEVRRTGKKYSGARIRGVLKLEQDGLFDMNDIAEELRQPLRELLEEERAIIARDGEPVDLEQLFLDAEGMQ